MIEIYTGNVGKANLTTYDHDGLPAEPDTLPSVVVSDAETGVVIPYGQPYLKDEDYIGEYEYIISPSATTVDRVLKLEWSYVVDGQNGKQIEYLYVTTPYATVDEIIDELGFSPRPEDYNYFSHDKIASAERAARLLINNELGYKLGKYSKTLTAYGTGADVLYVGEKILSISSLQENDEVVIDNSNNINTFGYPVEITETGNSIRIVRDPGVDIDEQEIIDPAGYNRGRFINGYRYDIAGVFGWNYIPVEIKQATFLLVNDLLCSESTWRTKYLKKINTGQMSVEISSLSFAGTGNAIADALLQQFKSIQAVII